MTLSNDETEKLVVHSRTILALAYDPQIDANDLYHSIPLGVVDAVFSINATAESTANVVQRLCTHVGIPLLRHTSPLPELTVSAFLSLHDGQALDTMAREIYQNRQRTSVVNGILKAEAVQRVCTVLRDFGVENWATIAPMFENPDIEKAIRQIPGQKSGVSFRAFCMQLGNQDYVKPDRMLLRFISNAIGRRVDTVVCEQTIKVLSQILQQEFPHLTPRALDARIWHYQRTVKP
jgi:hypothetical protein